MGTGVIVDTVRCAIGDEEVSDTVGNDEAKTCVGDDDEGEGTFDGVDDEENDDARSCTTQESSQAIPDWGPDGHQFFEYKGKFLQKMPQLRTYKRLINIAKGVKSNLII